MLVPLSWLKEYVDIDVTPEELEKKLFDGGFEVEERYQVEKTSATLLSVWWRAASRSRRPIFMCAR